MTPDVGHMGAMGALAELWMPQSVGAQATLVSRHRPLVLASTHSPVHCPPWARHGCIPLRAEADITAWAHLDSMDLNMPRTWQLQGNARAGSVWAVLSSLPWASQQRVEVYHWGDSQIEGVRLTQVREGLGNPGGGRGGRARFCPLCHAKHRHCGVNRRRAQTRRLWARSGEEACDFPFCRHDVADSMTWRFVS